MQIVENGRGLTDYYGALSKLKEIGLDCTLAVGIVIKLTPQREVASLIREFIGVVLSNDEQPKIVAVVYQRPTGEWNVDKRTKIIERAFVDHPLTKNFSTSLYSFMLKHETKEAK